MKLFISQLNFQQLDENVLCKWVCKCDKPDVQYSTVQYSLGTHFEALGFI